MINMPRVLGLLEEISRRLNELREEVSENNPESVGVLERLLVYIEVQKDELRKERFSFESLSNIMKFIVNLIDIIGKYNNTLCCHVSRYLAALNIFKLRVNKKWRLVKISSYLELTQI